MKRISLIVLSLLALSGSAWAAVFSDYSQGEALQFVKSEGF